MYQTVYFCCKQIDFFSFSMCNMCERERECVAASAEPSVCHRKHAHQNPGALLCEVKSEKLGCVYGTQQQKQKCFPA